MMEKLNGSHPQPKLEKEDLEDLEFEVYDDDGPLS